MRVALGLRTRGWRPAILSLMPPVGYAPQLRAGGVPVGTAGLTRGRPTLDGWQRAYGYARAWRPNVMCAFLYHAVVLAATLAPLVRAPLVGSIRDPSFGSPRRLRTAGLLHRFGPLRRVVANSDTIAADLRGRGIFRDDALEVIPNGIVVGDRPRLAHAERAALRSGLGVDDDEFLWLFIGNFQAPKDHPNLLSAFAELRRREHRTQLRLVGLGEPSAELRLQLGALAPHAVHLGERGDVLDLLECADALVMSSSSEGVPNVILEAFSVARPVVATSVGGIPELVQPGRNGFLCPARDSMALADTMERLLRLAPAERARLGCAGRELVTGRYAMEAVLDRWESVLHSSLRAPA